MYDPLGINQEKPQYDPLGINQSLAPQSNMPSFDIKLSPEEMAQIQNKIDDKTYTTKEGMFFSDGSSFLLKDRKQPDNETVIKTADSSKSFFDDVKSFLFEESPYVSNAQAMNAYQVARDLKIPINKVDKNVMRQYAEKQGVYTQPENKDFFTKLALAPVTVGLMTSPLSTLFGLGTFAGLSEIENFAVSKAKGESYEFGAGKGMPDLVPENTSEGVKDILWLSDMAWQAVGAGVLTAGAKDLSGKFVNKFMRDVTEAYNLPSKVYISPEKIREFHGLGREDVISPEVSDLLKDTNLTREDYVEALKNGIDIEIPTEKIVTHRDKPWVQKLKSYFKISPFEETVKTPAEKPQAKKPVAGLIEGQERSINDIVRDIDFFARQTLDESGEVSRRLLEGEILEVHNRLAKDFEVFKQRAKESGKDVFKYMVDNGISEKAANSMLRLVRTYDLDKRENKETWLLTGWKNEPPVESGEVNGSSESTLTEPMRTRPDEGAGVKNNIALENEFVKNEEADNINALLNMAAVQDKAAGDLTENPSYDAIRQKAAQLAFEIISKKIDFQKRKAQAALKRQGEEAARLTPVGQALDYILEKGGISKKAISNYYDKDTVKELMRKRPGLIANEGTLEMDVVADQFGFETDDDLVNSILDWEGIKAEGVKQAESFDKYYSDLISKAELEDFHIKLLEEEEKILSRLLKGNAPKPAKGLKKFIRQETGQVRVDELMISEYDALTAAMKKAERASRKAFREGNIEGALEEKIRQKEIAERKKARLQAKQEAKDIHDDILSIMKDDNLPVDYKERIEDFLSDYDLYPRSDRTRKRIESTREFMDRMEEEGEDVSIPKSLLSKIERYGRMHWKELNLDQLKDIYDQVKMMAHLGKLKNELIAAQKGRDYNNTVSTILDSIQKNWPSVNISPEQTETMLLEKSTWQEFKEKKNAYFNELVKPEYIFRRLDKWEELGPVWTSLYKPNKLQVIFEPFTKKGGGKWAREKYKIEGVPQILTKEKMILVALNTGNEGNLNALREGLQWNDDQIKAVISKLTEEEWKLVKDVWNLYDEMFPSLSDVYLKMTGAKLQKVEGRYHPLVFDRTLSWIADKNAAEADNRDFFQTIYTKPKPESGFTVERKGGRLAPKLAFDAIFKHLADVNHYVSHVEAVRDIQKLISDPRIRAAIESAPEGIGGADAYKQLMPWLQEIAKPKTDPLSLTESALKTIRKNTTSVALALKFSVAAFQWLGTTQSIEAVGHNQFVKGFVDFYTHRQDMVETIKSKSPELANRSQSWDRELRDAYGKLGLEKFKGSQLLKDAYFSLITLMDMAVAYPTWQAAYTQGIEKFKGDETQAINYADMKVRESQGNALPKDMAAIQRGGELKKMVTMFYTFFSSMHNQVSEAQTRFKYGDKNIIQLLKSWWWIVVAPAILQYMMTERKAPTPIKIAKESFQYRMGGYPVIRDITSSVFGEYDYQFSPAARFGKVAGKAIGETVKLPTDDGEFDKWLRYSFESAGYLTGLPTGQALITMKGFNDLANGETSDLTRLLMRKPRED